MPSPGQMGGPWRSLGYGKAGEILRSFAIITTAANATMGELHDRMPVILEPTDWPIWLGEVAGDPTALLRPAEDHVLQLWPVSRRVNTPRINDAHLLDRVPDAPVDDAGGGQPGAGA
jgi:putative SOS response-associated peptidase YedK